MIKIPRMIISFILITAVSVLLASCGGGEENTSTGGHIQPDENTDVLEQQANEQDRRDLPVMQGDALRHTEPPVEGAEGSLNVLPRSLDLDQDGVPNVSIMNNPEARMDNCPEVFNPDQADENHNGIGDRCENTSP